jgi:Ca2+/Na+ antiporter
MNAIGTNQSTPSSSLKAGLNRVQATMANYVLGVLWFVPIAFMFFCQHYVCDEYFIPAIKVLVDTAGTSDNPWVRRWGNPAVAGATVMALGCNGPELFCNLISLYIASDAGIGVVIGSEIFNLLIIIGCSVLFCPNQPVVLEVPSFIRDCVFYALSIFLLVWALMLNTPNQVDPNEALVLLAAEVLFVVTVYFTDDIVAKFSGKKPSDLEKALVPEKKPMGADDATFHGISVKIAVDYGTRQEPETVGDLQMEPGQGALMIHEEITPEPKEKTVCGTSARGSIGLGTHESVDVKLDYQKLREVRMSGQGVMYMDFKQSAFSTITVKVECATAKDRKELVDLIKKNSGHRTDGVLWFETYDGSLGSAIKHFKHNIKEPGVVSKIVAIFEVLADILLKSTLHAVDVKDVNKQHRWVACFCGAMCWLALFSFLMLEVATQINICIPQLSMAFLGVTLCAVGTSFPNAIASILMAQDGLSAAAIANALGSNVQNVFLAMAFPWLIYMATPTAVANVISVNPVPQWTPVPQEPPEKGQSVVEGVEWMLGTLILVIILAIMPETCAFNKTMGRFLCFVYVIYLGWTSYEALS